VTARKRLPIAKRPRFVEIGEEGGRKIGLGYRRNQGPGAWVVRISDGRESSTTQAIGSADDDDIIANGVTILTFYQARDLALAFARNMTSSKPQAESTGGRPITVSQALDRYEANLKSRGRSATNNVRQVLIHLDDSLAQKAVALLVADELEDWKERLAEETSPATANRTATGLRAALYFAARRDRRITNEKEWRVGLARLPNAESARNIILNETDVRAIVATAYEENWEFGLLIETSDVTGARYSQITRLEVCDLQDDRPDPRVMMPPSRKGKDGKSLTPIPVPITRGLASRMRETAGKRRPNERLLLKGSGAAWQRDNQTIPFNRTVARINAMRDARGETPLPEGTSIYALRHTSIVRQLLGNVPIRVVAVNHDTSVDMIEKHYSRYINDHADALVRRTLVEAEVVEFPLQRSNRRPSA
jgi:hypothetical protein